MLKKAQKKLITQKQAAAELELTRAAGAAAAESGWQAQGDKAVVHALRGRRRTGS